MASGDRMVRVSDMVGAADIADRLGVEHVTVLAWRTRYPDFPEPLAKIGAAWVWAWPDVQAWADRRKPSR